MSSSPHAAHVIALGELSSASAPDPHAAPAVRVNPLHQIKARLEVRVGDAVITVGEMMGLREHQVLTLNQPVDAPVDVLLEGKVVARGQLVAVEDHFAVRITELPIPLEP